MKRHPVNMKCLILNFFILFSAIFGTKEANVGETKGTFGRGINYKIYIVILVIYLP